MNDRVNLTEEEKERITTDLIGKLQLLRDRDWPADRASLARLRRSLGQTDYSSDTGSVVQPFLHRNTPDEIEETLYVIGPLFAFHRLPFSGERRANMGDHFRMVADGDLSSAVERRFLSLLACEPDELPDALRQAVTLLKSRDIPINWHRLFLDVYEWLDRRPQGEQKRQSVRLRWSRALWRLPKRQAQVDEEQPLSETNL